MRTNDGELKKQLWLWDEPYNQGNYWDNMRNTIESNMDPQPVADDLSDGYIADRMYWDAQSTVPMVPGTPTVLDSQTQEQDFGPTPEASPTMVQSSDNSVVLGPSETISIVAATLDADARTTRDPTDDARSSDVRARHRRAR